MAIRLDAITLPDDLTWPEEYDWSNVTQTIDKSLTGSLIIQEASQAKGRTINLKGEVNSAWIDKATLDLLKVKADTPDLQMSLDYHGTIYNVMFARGANSSGIKAIPIYTLADPGNDHVYSVELNFIEV